jgi:hypothetical protein
MVISGEPAGSISLERTGAFDHRDQDTDESWQRAVDALNTAFRSSPSAGKTDTSSGNR